MLSVWSLEVLVSALSGDLESEVFRGLNIGRGPFGLTHESRFSGCIRRLISLDSKALCWKSRGLSWFMSW